MRLYLSDCDIEVKLRITGEEVKITFVTDEGDGLDVCKSEKNGEITTTIKQGWINQLKTLIGYIEKL